VIEADVLLHVRDIAHGETEAEAADVQNVLRQLGINPDDRSRLIEVWNKADLLGPGERERLAAVAERSQATERPALVSAVTGEGIDALLAEVEARIAEGRPSFRIVIEPTDGAASNWLHEEAEIIERQEGEGGRTELTVRIAPEKEPRLWKRFPQAERVP
jgi:GTP-binding protein HflX